jgi:CheY-like chemotaxis protein
MQHAATLTPSSFESPRVRLRAVDDEQLLRERFGRIQTLYGYEAEMAEDGVAALAWLPKWPFDLVVTDRQMPELDGVSILLAIRSAGSRVV